MKERLIYTEWRVRGMEEGMEEGVERKEGLKEREELCRLSSDAEVTEFNVAH